MKNHSKIGKIMDSLFFPIRAFFMGEKGYLGLSSRRDERMRLVSNFCKGKVLDVGCGRDNLFINKYIGSDNGIGIDVFPYRGVGMIVEDMRYLPFEDCSFDTVTLIAVGGHIPKSKRNAEFREFSRVLKPGGLLIMTEGEPISSFIIHKWVYFFYPFFGIISMDAERGMEKDEEFCMPRKELLSYLNTPPMHFLKRKRFMWGLNNIYIAEKDKSTHEKFR